MNRELYIDRVKGSLIGGAAGDALGYPIEFDTITEIKDVHGEAGITEYECTWDELGNPVAQFSDDTQMTLFTAVGLMAAKANEDANIEDDIRLAYKDWLTTQRTVFGDAHSNNISWILGIKGLYAQRAPGNTCLSALYANENYNLENIANDSCGCGGVMRVAPIGLINLGLTQEEIDLLGAQVAALTHGHSLGYIPSAALVHMISRIMQEEEVNLYSIVEETIEAMQNMFVNDSNIDEFVEIMNKAIEFSKNGRSDIMNIRFIGRGWVGHEALAVATYCALKYSHDLSKALIAAVNHNGDSDSTGAITGNIVGAIIGYSKIDQKWKEHLELKDLILEISNDLCVEDPQSNPGWMIKYHKGK